MSDDDSLELSDTLDQMVSDLDTALVERGYTKAQSLLTLSLAVARTFVRLSLVLEIPRDKALELIEFVGAAEAGESTICMSAGHVSIDLDKDVDDKDWN